MVAVTPTSVSVAAASLDEAEFVLEVPDHELTARGRADDE